MPKNNYMITIFTKNFNSFSQDLYFNFIESTPLNKLVCPSCKHRGCLKIHAYYKRKVRTHETTITLSICRVKCSFCHVTHAILPSSIIPYFQIPLIDIINTIKSYESHKSLKDILKDIASLDFSNYYRIISIYLKYWKQRLISFKISLSSIDDLVISCLKLFFCQFMQIAKIPNILFLDTT